MSQGREVMEVLDVQRQQVAKSYGAEGLDFSLGRRILFSLTIPFPFFFSFFYSFSFPFSVPFPNSVVIFEFLIRFRCSLFLFLIHFPLWLSSALSIGLPFVILPLLPPVILPCLTGVDFGAEF